jgi:hypothetical protein
MSKAQKILISIVICIIIIVVFGICALQPKKNTLGITGNNNSLYYYIEDQNTLYDQPSQKGETSGRSFPTYSIYKINPSLDAQDELVAKLEPGAYYNFLKSNKPGTILLSAEGKKLLTLDESSKKISVLLNAPAGKVISDATFMKDGRLLYITADDTGDAAQNSVLHINNVGGVETEKAIPLTEKSPLFAGFSINFIDPSGKTAYVVESGGDAGLVWQTNYKVDLVNKKVTNIGKAGSESDDYSTITTGTPLGLFNPSGTKAVYAKASLSKTDPSLFDHSGAFEGCLDYNSQQAYLNEGDVIILRDTQTGNEKEIYRELSYKDNLCKLSLRKIFSLYWLDDTKLLFTTVNSISTIDVITGNIKTLYTFPSFVDPKAVNRPRMVNIYDKYMLLSDGKLLNYESGRILDFSSNHPNYQLVYPFKP